MLFFCEREHQCFFIWVITVDVHTHLVTGPHFIWHLVALRFLFWQNICIVADSAISAKRKTITGCLSRWPYCAECSGLIESGGNRKYWATSAD